MYGVIAANVCMHLGRYCTVERYTVIDNVWSNGCNVYIWHGVVLGRGMQRGIMYGVMAGNLCSGDGVVLVRDMYSDGYYTS